MESKWRKEITEVTQMINSCNYRGDVKVLAEQILEWFDKKREKCSTFRPYNILNRMNKYCTV